MMAECGKLDPPTNTYQQLRFLRYMLHLQYMTQLILILIMLMHVVLLSIGG